LICTSGSATTVVLTFLDTVTGCTFAYHGDFDFPSLAGWSRRHGMRNCPRSWMSMGIALHQEAALDLLVGDLA
jgi:hypothetical protein